MSSALHPDGKANPSHASSNKSHNPALNDLIDAHKLSRRAFLQGSLGITVATAFGGLLFDGLVRRATSLQLTADARQAAGLEAKLEGVTA